MTLKQKKSTGIMKNNSSHCIIYIEINYKIDLNVLLIKILTISLFIKNDQQLHRYYPILAHHHGGDTYIINK